MDIFHELEIVAFKNQFFKLFVLQIFLKTSKDIFDDHINKNFRIKDISSKDIKAIIRGFLYKSF